LQVHDFASHRGAVSGDKNLVTRMLTRDLFMAAADPLVATR